MQNPIKADVISIEITTITIEKIHLTARPNPEISMFLQLIYSGRLNFEFLSMTGNFPRKRSLSGG